MRIALVSPYDHSRYGGVTEHVRGLADELGHRGHVVTVIAPSTARLSPPVRYSLRRVGGAVGVPSNGSIARISVSPLSAARIGPMLREVDADVVHVHEPLCSPLTLAAVAASRAPVVGTFHACRSRDGIYGFARPVLRRFFARLAGRIAVSEAALDSVAAFGGQCVVIPNGVSLDRFHPSVEPLPQLRGPEKVVLFVGRLEPRKGLSTLRAALSRLGERAPRLVVVGEGDWLGPPDPRVTLVGPVDPGLLPRYYASADVVCAPSLCGESFGLVLLEALCSGRAVVASDLPGYRSVLRPGVDALLVPPGDAAALAGALDRALADDAMRMDLGLRGRARAAAFAWPAIADLVMDVYVRATDGRAVSTPDAFTVYCT